MRAALRRVERGNRRTAPGSAESFFPTLALRATYPHPPEPPRDGHQSGDGC